MRVTAKSINECIVIGVISEGRLKSCGRTKSGKVWGIRVVWLTFPVILG